VFFRKVTALGCFEAGAHPELAAFAEGLEPVRGETVISKQYASAFFGTSLASTLTALGVDTVLIAGLSTSGCVRASAVDCCQHGFIPVVVREAVGDRAPGPHESNLFDLQAKYAEVASLVDVLTYLRNLAP
jgi:nicotinamidase-related amidase